MNIIQKAAMRLVKNEVDDYISRFLSGQPIGDSAQNIDTETALKYSAVFACCRVLSETFASVPCILYKKDEKGERKAVTDHPIYDLMHNAPNEEMSHFNYSETMMMGMNLNGNAIAQKLTNKKGELVGLYPIIADVKRDEVTKKLFYKVKQTGDTQDISLKRSEIFHVPGPSLDGINGLSPISYAASAIRLGLTYERFGVNLFKNGANPSGAFGTEGELSEAAYNRLKSELKEKHTGIKNAGVPMLLEGGLKWQQFTVNPTDAQLLESKNFQIEDICRIYRVPQHLVNKLDRSTNNNIEHQSLEFVMYTMLPIFKRFEECENAQLLTRAERMNGYFLEYKIDGLLRGDSAARAALYSNGRQWGWLSANDIRRLENLPSIMGGDIYLQPTNMIQAGAEADADAKTLEEVERIMKERGNE